MRSLTVTIMYDTREAAYNADGNYYKVINYSIALTVI